MECLPPALSRIIKVKQFQEHLEKLDIEKSPPRVAWEKDPEVIRSKARKIHLRTEEQRKYLLLQVVS